MATETSNRDWIEWSGGECPLPAFAHVDLRFREDARRGDVSPAYSEAPQFLCWQHRRGRRFGGDIIAYRHRAD